MGSFINRMRKLHLRRQSSTTESAPTEFLVTNREERTAASNALARVRIPVAPQIRTLETAYTITETLLRRFRKNDVRIVEKKGLSKDEAYKANEQTFKKLLDDRNSIVELIAEVLQPVIGVVGQNAISIEDLNDRLEKYERRLAELETMMKGVYGKAPTVPPLPGGKQPWSSTLKEAAQEVISEYQIDSLSKVRQFRSLRDASDQFFEKHKFVHKPDNFTKEGFYENVKKAQGN